MESETGRRQPAVERRLGARTHEVVEHALETADAALYHHLLRNIPQWRRKARPVRSQLDRVLERAHNHARRARDLDAMSRDFSALKTRDDRENTSRASTRRPRASSCCTNACGSAIDNTACTDDAGERRRAGTRRARPVAFTRSPSSSRTDTRGIAGATCASARARRRPARRSAAFRVTMTSVARRIDLSGSRHGPAGSRRTSSVHRSALTSTMSASRCTRRCWNASSSTAMSAPAAAPRCTPATRSALTITGIVGLSARCTSVSSSP